MSKTVSDLLRDAADSVEEARSLAGETDDVPPHDEEELPDGTTPFGHICGDMASTIRELAVIAEVGERSGDRE